MPLKTQHRKSHHTAHRKERRTKHFLKVYAPYIPLLLIVGCGIGLANHSEIRSFKGEVNSYATNMTDDGLLETTNQMRVRDGLQPLAFNPLLDQAAQAKAEDMSTRNYWAHNTPDGKEPWIFIENTEYSYRKAAENLAFGFATSASAVNGWMNSPGHRANILDSELHDVGFGIVNNPDFRGEGPETIVVAMYAQPTEGSGDVQSPIAGNQVDNGKPQDISLIQSLTAGKAPWSGFVAGLAIGSILTYLIAKHFRSIRRKIKQGENFIIHHPLLDITLIALACLAFMAGQTIGKIY